MQKAQLQGSIVPSGCQILAQKKSVQTIQTQNKLLLQEQFDRDLYCLRNNLTLKVLKADNKIYVPKSFIQAISCWKFKDKKANSVNPDEAAHYEPLY